MKLLRYLTLMPSVTFNLIVSEIFPWAFIYSMIKQHKKLNKYLIVIVYLFLVSTFFTFYNYNYFGVETFRSLFSYFNCLFIFFHILNTEDNKYIITIKYFFWFLIILGLVQALGFLSILDVIFTRIVPRGTLGNESLVGNRGVSLLASEPQRAFIELVFLYVVIRKYYSLNIKHDILFLLYGFLIIRSFTGVVFCLFLFFSYYPKKILILATLAFTTIINFGTTIKNRSIDLILIIASVSGVYTFFESILQLSGFRLFSLYSSYKFMLFNPLGGGIGSWPYTSLESYNLSGFESNEIEYFNYYGNGHWIPLRPTSFFSNLAIDVGLLGILIFIVFIYKAIQYKSLNKSQKIYLLVFSIYLIGFGEAGHPIPWIVSAIILNNRIWEKKFQ